MKNTPLEKLEKQMRLVTALVIAFWVVAIGAIVYLFKYHL